MKKFLTFVLVLAMVLSVSSFAMAADVADAATLQAAIDGAVDGVETTITLTAPVAVSADSSITVPEGKVIVLDLAGQTISHAQTAFNSVTLINDGTLTIKDSVGGGKITSTYTGDDDPSYGKGVYTIYNNGIMTITDVTIENLTTVSPLMRSALENRSASRDVSLTLGAGSVVRCPEYIAMRQWITSTTYKNDIIIDGGTVEGGRRGIWMQLPSTDASKAFKASLTVKSGIVTSNDESDNAIYLYSYGNSNDNVEINISGGTINGNIGLLGGAGKNNGTPKISISGGSMTSVEDYSGNLKEIISGGSFTEDPSALLAAEYVVSKDADGNYVPAKATNVNAPAVGEDASVTTSNSDEIVKITKEQVNALADGKSLVVTADEMTFTFSKDLLNDLLSNGGSYVAIKIKKIGQTELNDVQQEAIGSTAAKLVFTAEIYVDGEYVGDKLNGNKVQVYIPVRAVDLGTTQASPNLDGYSLVYISDDGKLEIIANAEAGAYEINAELPHFSEYAVIKTEDANKIIASQKTPATSSSGSGISVKYNGGNSFSTSNPSVPTGVEIDGVPVTFNGTGSNFTVGCISSDAKWVTVRWNSTSVTTNFTPDGLVECTTVSIPKTGDMSFWAAVAAFFGF